MSANLETIAGELQELGYPPEVTSPILELSRNSKLPQSVELEKWKKIAEDEPEGRIKLGLDAREIALSDQIINAPANKAGFVFTNASTGVALRVFAYSQVGEKHLQGEISRLGIIVEHPGNVKAIRDAITYHPLISPSIDIDINVLSDNFGKAIPAASIINNQISHWPHPEKALYRDQGLARLLVDSIKTSQQFGALQPTA
jgi:hypothetical protein